MSTATLASYSETNQDSFFAVGFNTIKVAQTFVSKTGTLGSCQFYLEKYGTPTGNAVVKIYNITGTYGTNAKPTGTELATSNNFDVSTIPSTTAYNLCTFTFSGANKIQLLNSQKYALSIEYPGGDVNNRVRVGCDSSSPSYGGNYSTYITSWLGGFNDSDICFYVFGDNSITANFLMFMNKI